MYAVCVEKIFALLVGRQSTLGTSKSLTCETPQQTLALDTERGRGGRQNHEVVRCRTGDWVDERLQCLLVDVLLLYTTLNLISKLVTSPSKQR